MVRGDSTTTARSCRSCNARPVEGRRGDRSAGIAVVGTGATRRDQDRMHRSFVRVSGTGRRRASPVCRPPSSFSSKATWFCAAGGSWRHSREARRGRPYRMDGENTVELAVLVSLGDVNLVPGPDTRAFARTRSGAGLAPDARNRLSRLTVKQPRFECTLVPRPPISAAAAKGSCL